MTKLAEARAEAVKKALAAQNIMNQAGADVTHDQIKAVENAVAEVKEIDSRIAASKGALDAVNALAESGLDLEDNSYEPGDGSGMAKADTFGERYVKSKAFSGWQKSHPSGLGDGSNFSLPKVKIGSLDEYLINRKANGATLGTPVAHIQPIRYPTVDMVDRKPLTLLDVIGHGQMAGNFEYVQITAVTNNTAIVPENLRDTDPLKPTSDMTTQLADCKAYTFADGYVVTNQLLSDAPAFASYMNTAVTYNLDSTIENKVLNGTGTSEPMGILHTTGVQEQTYTAAEGAMDVAKATRRGISKVTQVNGMTTAVVMNPEDVVELDLMQDADKRFYGLGPFGIGPRTLWGVPVIESAKVTKGQALLGDFNQVQLLDREGLAIEAFNQHLDLAARNQVYVRAELRAGVVIWRPNRLVVVKAA